jgi:hypothetical protein
MMRKDKGVQVRYSKSVDAQGGRKKTEAGRTVWHERAQYQAREQTMNVGRLLR